MKFTTFDMEFADIILPSICSISIIDWDENGIISAYKTLINPDCEFDERLQARHRITPEMVKNAPTIQEAWIDIYNKLENKLVFSHYANRNIRALENLAYIKYLKLPPLVFCCTASISRKLWPYFPNDKLPVITERLGINNKHFDSFEDAKSVGYIVGKAMEDTQCFTFNEFFAKLGFCGGYIENGERKVYRAIKEGAHYIVKDKNGRLIDNPTQLIQFQS